MENTIDSRLIDLLSILDARATINIYTDEDTRMFSGEVYKFLANDKLMHKYKNYEITAISFGLVDNILITEK